MQDFIIGFFALAIGLPLFLVFIFLAIAQILSAVGVIFGAGADPYNTFKDED